MSSQIILSVDDEETIREMLQMGFEMEGYEVGTAANGKDALEWLRTNPRPCLILLDYMMPIMNGWEFLEALDADPELSKLDVPIVMLTAFFVKESHPRLREILNKPVDLDKLLAVAKKYCS